MFHHLTKSLKQSQQMSEITRQLGRSVKEDFLTRREVEQQHFTNKKLSSFWPTAYWPNKNQTAKASVYKWQSKGNISYPKS